MLGVTRQAVQLMANNGQLIGAKVGNGWVFRRAVVLRAAADRQQLHGADVDGAAGASSGQISGR